LISKSGMKKLWKRLRGSMEKGWFRDMIWMNLPVILYGMLRSKRAMMPSQNDTTDWDWGYLEWTCCLHLFTQKSARMFS
jgi:hypothetical protein